MIFPSCEWCGHEMASRPARHKNGGQALDILTMPLKIDSGKPTNEGIQGKSIIVMNGARPSRKTADRPSRKTADRPSKNTAGKLK